MAYNEAKRWSKQPEKFGTGCIEGIVAPESANNAISGGALIPLLTLGIPGDGGTAVMLGAFMMHGLVPGPMLFKDFPVEVYSIICGLFIAIIFMGFLGFARLRMFAKIPAVRQSILLPIVFVFCFIGTYALNFNIDDIFFMIAAGVVGFIMLKFDFSMPPIVLGVILGGIIERNLVRSLVMSNNSFTIFFTNPISCILLVVSFLTVFVPVARVALRKAKAKGNNAVPPEQTF